MLRVDAAPFAVFFQVDLALDEFAVLARPIIDATALAARYFYQLILRHARYYTPKAHTVQLLFAYRHEKGVSKFYSTVRWWRSR